MSPDELDVADRRVVVGVDVGSSATKAALVGSDGRILATATASGEPFRTEHGSFERDPNEWWTEVSTAVRSVTQGHADRVIALALTGQMLGIVPVSKGGDVVRPAIQWADARADEQATRLIRRFLGPLVLRLVGGGVPSSKDVVPKMLWLADHEPDHHRRTDAYLDVVGYLVLRATGRVVMEHSAASATGLFDQRRGRWSSLLARSASVDPHKLPELVAATDVAGLLRAEAARTLGLREGIPVVSAGGDAVAGTVGAGAWPMIQVGTSGWVSTVSERRRLVPPAGTAALCWVERDRHLEIAASEAVGPCLTWITRLLYERDDEVGLELFDRDSAAASAGAAGLLFAPWLIGERSPFNDPTVRGGLFNVGLDHGRPELARAVMEGIALNFRWMLEYVVDDRDAPVRIGGGVARSDHFVQVLADVTGRTVERVASPRHSTAAGAALTGLVAVGELPDVAAAARCVAVDKRFEPASFARDVDAGYDAFRRLPRLLHSLVK